MPTPESHGDRYQLASAAWQAASLERLTRRPGTLEPAIEYTPPGVSGAQIEYMYLRAGWHLTHLVQTAQAAAAGVPPLAEQDGELRQTGGEAEDGEDSEAEEEWEREQRQCEAATFDELVSSGLSDAAAHAAAYGMYGGGGRRGGSGGGGGGGGARRREPPP